MELEVEQEGHHRLGEQDDRDLVDLRVRAVVEVAEVEREEGALAEHVDGQQEHLPRHARQLEHAEALEPLPEEADALRLLRGHLRKKDLFVLREVEVLVAEEEVEHGEELEVVPDVHRALLQGLDQRQVLAERVWS